MAERGLSASPRASGWLVVVGLVAALFFLHFTRHYTGTFAFAAFLAILLWPLEQRFARVLPRWISKLVVVLIFTALGFGVFFAITYTVQVMVARLTADDTLQIALGRLGRSLESIALPGAFEPATALGEQLTGTLRGLAHGTLVGVEIVLLTYVFTVLALTESHRVVARVRAVQDRTDLAEIGARIAQRFQAYVLIRTINGLVAGVLATILCWAVGVSDPVAWGLLTWLLYYIPTLGHIGAAIPPVLLSLVEHDDTWRPIAVALGFFSLEMLVGELLEPHMQGRSHRLPPSLVLFSVVFWGWVWGIVGAILGVPITLGVLTWLASNERTAWVAVLLGHADES